MRKRYLIQLKNELFMQGFVFSEIHDILVDTAMYFDDSQTEEDVQKSILKNLGTPKEFARSIKQSDTSQPAGKMRVFRIILAFIAPLAFIIGIFVDGIVMVYKWECVSVWYPFFHQKTGKKADLVSGLLGFVDFSFAVWYVYWCSCLYRRGACTEYTEHSRGYCSCCYGLLCGAERYHCSVLPCGVLESGMADVWYPCPVSCLDLLCGFL